MRILLLAALCLMAASCSMPGSRVVGEVPAGSYCNPVLEQDTPDPFVLPLAGRFYCYATESGPPGFQVLESEDLVHWFHRGVAFVPPSSAGNYWAPEVIARRGRLWMIYSAKNPATKEHDLAIAVGDEPTGPFRPWGKLVSGLLDGAECDNGHEPCRGAIDGTFFEDVDGALYFAYSQESPRCIVLRRLDEDMKSVGAERVVLIRADREEEAGVVEAPTLLIRDGMYHLIYSAGPFQGRSHGHRYTVRHASAPSLRGPWIKDEKPVMESVPGETYGPGHQCVVTLPGSAGGEPEDWIVYHGWDSQGQPQYGRNRIGRSLRIDRLRWVDGRPETAGPTLDIEPAPTIR